MISYQPLWVTLAKKRLKKKDLYTVASSATVARMGNEDYVSLELIDKLCLFLDCPVSDVIEVLPGPQKGAAPEAEQPAADGKERPNE